MRFILFVLTCIAASSAFAAAPIVGLLKKDRTGISIQIGETKTQYKLETTSADVLENLAKLSSGDLITGLGNIKTQQNSIELESIDYVGLKRMLGQWYSPEGIVEVKSFDRLSFYPFMALKNFTLINQQFRAVDFKYSLTPTEGREWVLFLSDNKTTTFATIQFYKGNARLKIFDSDTGIVIKTLNLNRWSSR